ncbi:MAG: Fis family transcriptional regulator, partial [Acidobacteriaceae bacterium]|nr:Fis family transcriptional regulator [Acidobacteriaceae bacterium]
QRHLPAAPPPAPEMLPLAEVERRHTRWVLDQLDGNKSKAADLLGITRSTLYRILGEAP